MTFINNKRIHDYLKQKKAGVNLLLTIPKVRQKGSGKTYILLFKKNFQGNPVNTGNQRDMPCCPHNPGVPGLSEKTSQTNAVLI